MNRKHLLLLTLFLSQSAPVWGMDHDDASSTPHHSTPKATAQTHENQDTKKLQEDINNAKKETQRRLACYDDKLEKVIVVGYSGNGKSALIHGLANTAIVKDEGGEFKVKSSNPNPLPDIIIGKGRGKHGTSLPGSWYDKAHNVVFWDCPGFGDPAPHGEDIINGAAIRELFSPGTKARIVLVLEEGVVFEGQPSSFQKLLNEVTAVFPNLDQLKQSLSLVVTKHIPNKNPYTRLNTLQQKGTLEILTHPARDLFNFLVKEQAQRIALLPSPVEEGPYKFDRDTIFKMILKSTESTLNPEVKPYLNETSKVLTADLAQNLNAKISDLIEKEWSTVVGDHCNTQTNQKKGNMEVLRTTFKTIKDDLNRFKKGLLDLSKIPDDKLKAHLDNIFTQSIKELSTASLRGMIETLSFLKTINNEIIYSADGWVHHVTTIIEKIPQLSENPQDQDLILRELTKGKYSIRNMGSHEALFLTDKFKMDKHRILEGRHKVEDKSLFVFEKRNQGYLIKNVKHQKYLFLANSRFNNHGRVVESKKYPQTSGYCDIFKKNGKYIIKMSGEYLFLSADKEGKDSVCQAKESIDEERGYFTFEYRGL